MTNPASTSVARLPDAATRGAALEQSKHELRQLSTQEREACAAHKGVAPRRARRWSLTCSGTRRCSSTCAVAGKDTSYVHAQKKPARTGRRQTVQEAESAVAAAISGASTPESVLAQLHSEAALSTIAETLRRRLDTLKREAERDAQLDVSLTPSK